MNDYEKLMKKCISLGKKGIGNVSPNPMVGCVVLDKHNNIISTGYHHKYGENHAERDALLKLHNGEEKGGVLVVNLEPCSHFGKTPPCTNLIIERGVKTVVIGCRDKNPKVNGIKQLKDAGINVITGVLEDDCKKLNEVFFTNFEENRTFVALKTATTLDGKISTSTGDSKWITSDKSRNYVRKLRKMYDGILTSSSTVLADNPTMEHQTKIILDRCLKTDFNSNIYKTGKIYVFTEKDSSKVPPKNVEIIKCNSQNGKLDLKEILSKLFELGIKSVFVEAGGRLNGDFIKNNLTDKIYHFISLKILNDNTGRCCFDGDSVQKISNTKQFILNSTKKIGADLLLEYSYREE
jgi:diaminohydroxyphosphoribosylaminopyrimidine deaminase/5-amino-6-(5-phosphoribosylamino)uracil reductase